MATKKGKKNSGKQIVKPVRGIKGYSVRGKNTVVFEGKNFTPERINNTVTQSPQIAYRLRDNRFKIGVIVIITIKYRKQEFVRAFVSEPEFVVNKNNIAGFIRGCIEKLDNDFNARLESIDELNDGEIEERPNSTKVFDITRIKNIQVKFIYSYKG